MNKIIKYILSGAVAVSSAASCSSFLDREMYDRMDADAFFTRQSDLELYARGLIQKHLPSNTSICIGSDAYTDFVATKTSKDFFRPGIWNADKASGWSSGNWTLIRRANYFIENMGSAKDNVSEEVLNHYMGIARFWRAYSYFDKVKTFSDVPWIDHVVKEDEDLLFAPQDDREYVMSKVLEDLDFACKNCLDTPEFVDDAKTSVNKWVALAFKSRVCLFEGTFRKYHTSNPSTGNPWTNEYGTYEDFLEAAAEASKELMAGPFSLKKGDPETAFRSLFTSEVPDKSEFIWTRQYSSSLPALHDITWYYNSSTYGQLYSPTKDLVMMFLKRDGTPVGSETLTVNEEFEGRDCRLAQTINAPGHTYESLAGQIVPKVPDMTVSRTGYAFIKWNIEKEACFSSSKDYNSLPVFRLGEILLNYAEAKAELGLMDETIWNETVGALRERAGVTNIYPQGGSYVEDTFLKNYYAQAESGKNLSNIILEIRRERATELIMENGLRYYDLIRWHCGDLFDLRNTNGQGWRGMYVTADMYKNGFEFNGVKFKFGTKDANTTVGISTNTGNSNRILTDGNSGFIIYNYDLSWEDKMYINPIPTSARTLNPNLYQNKGW